MARVDGLKAVEAHLDEGFDGLDGGPGAGMGEKGEPPAVVDEGDRLLRRQLHLGHIARLVLAEKLLKGLVKAEDIALLDHDIGDMGPAEGPLAGAHLHHVEADGHTEVAQALEDLAGALDAVGAHVFGEGDEGGVGDIVKIAEDVGLAACIKGAELDAGDHLQPQLFAGGTGFGKG
ncbi:MAG: hypothetical protein BWY77_01643 [bacterium ADurb.Bin431]|nr:MAG: hypothetical protein BWY77_01643 [bacterium ADurb.Bin431]